MKLKKVSAIYKRSKRYVLYDKPAESGGGEQWLGDGSAAYLLEGIPRLNEDSLCRMFDISESQRDNLIIEQAKVLEGICWGDTDANESKAEGMELGLIYEGRELLPLMSREGIIFLDKKYLSPFDSEGEYIGLYQRKTLYGQVYIAVKAGLLIRGVIFPVEAASDKLINQLGDLFRECRRANERAKAQPEKGGGSRLIWSEGEPSEDGEK